MSNRAIGRLYGGNMNYGGGHSGGSGDLFGLQAKREQERMKLQADLEEKARIHQEQLDEQNQRFSTDLLKELRNDDVVKKHAEEAGIPLDQYIQQIVPENVKNTLQTAKMKGVSLNDPNTQPAVNMGTRLSASGIPPQMLGGTAGIGGITTVPQVPGVNAALNAPLGNQVLRGALQQDTTKEVGGFIDPKTGQRIGARPIEERRMTPQSIQTPFSPQDVSAIGAQPTTTPPTNQLPFGGQNDMAPIPANDQLKNGDPKYSTTPQQNWQSGDPLQRLLMMLKMGGGFNMFGQ